VNNWARADRLDEEEEEEEEEIYDGFFPFL
jgi:hypothetical protein